MEAVERRWTTSRGGSGSLFKDKEGRNVCVSLRFLSGSSISFVIQTSNKRKEKTVNGSPPTGESSLGVEDEICLESTSSGRLEILPNCSFRLNA